jgi:hypothetical protein
MDLESLFYNLNIKQKFRFIEFLKSLKQDGMKIAYIDRYYSDVSVDSLINEVMQNIEYDEIRKFEETAASLQQTTKPRKEWGVHRTHCCSKHGCKYGDADCPVAIELIKQDYDCESCSWDKYDDKYS